MRGSGVFLSAPFWYLCFLPIYKNKTARGLSEPDKPIPEIEKVFRHECIQLSYLIGDKTIHHETRWKKYWRARKRRNWSACSAKSWLKNFEKYHYADSKSSWVDAFEVFCQAQASHHRRWRSPLDYQTSLDFLTAKSCTVTILEP